MIDMTSSSLAPIQKNQYGLSWIDNEKLYQQVKKAFSRALGLTGTTQKNLPPDPFLIVAQAAITNTTFSESLSFEATRKINKTLSNAIGNMHQGILSVAPNWESLGTTGGVLDIKTKDGYSHPKYGKIVAEVKNRFNTIKSSDEQDVWDKIDTVARASNAQGFLFQIVPESAMRYDKLWEPSGRHAKDTVRCCDGATAYEIVFEHKDALFELYLALPEIIEDIKSRNGLSQGAPRPSQGDMERLYHTVMPR